MPLAFDATGFRGRDRRAVERFVRERNDALQMWRKLHSHFAFAQRERFVVKKERSFTEVVDAAYLRPALAPQIA